MTRCNRVLTRDIKAPLSPEASGGEGAEGLG